MEKKFEVFDFFSNIVMLKLLQIDPVLLNKEIRGDEFTLITNRKENWIYHRGLSLSLNPTKDISNDINYVKRHYGRISSKKDILINLPLILSKQFNKDIKIKMISDNTYIL